MPESTYRLQFHAGFTFADAERIVAYLADLGVTHAYASPYLAAKAGSTHGYDVIDHCSINPELGGEAAFESWVGELSKRGLGHILDTVPNHVGVATNDNRWWNDVLKHGPASRFATYFDIAWQGSPRPELHNKILLPVLGQPYADVLEDGQLKLCREGDDYFVNYHDRRFPIALETHPLIPANGDSITPDQLDALLERQHYRLAWWKTASDEINYRRFFDINDLAALSMERQEVFKDTHRFILDLVAGGKIAGLRIDHPDGLYDPKQYFERLQSAAGGSLYVVAEKILAPDEPLPHDWPVHGTSGYDFLIKTNGLFVDTAGEEAFTRLYEEWTGDATLFHEIVYQKKRLILKTSLASELQMLAHQLDRLAQADRRSRDFTLNSLRRALREVIACFPVYRTYITNRGVSETDVARTETAVEEAVRRNPKIEPSIFHFIRDTLLLRFGGDDLREKQARFAGKFQQLTAPATAKGVEDTAFYCYHRLISLNEVGGEPAHFGLNPDDLHAYYQDRQEHWPHALSALSTHDTKRSEDVRARINVLSEIPDQWRRNVARWRDLNTPHRTSIAPDEEYLLYQTLIGAWPLDPAEAGAPEFVQRIQAYMQKAMREAKLRTSWTAPNEQHETGVSDFIAKVVASKSFLDDFLPFQQTISHFGLLNSLSQTLLRLTAPGVPDTYQGTELWDFSLVDPDNRRPVDYDRRRQLLNSLDSQIADQLVLSKLARHLLDTRHTAEVKLFVTRQALRLRRHNPGVFTTGQYLPIRPAGRHADHVFAFARIHEGTTAVTIVPRLLARMFQGQTRIPIGLAWGDTHIPVGHLPRFRRLFNLFTTEGNLAQDVNRSPAILLADVLQDFPVALLITVDD